MKCRGQQLLHASSGDGKEEPDNADATMIGEADGDCSPGCVERVLRPAKRGNVARVTSAAGSCMAPLNRRLAPRHARWSAEGARASKSE